MKKKNSWSFGLLTKNDDVGKRTYVEDDSLARYFHEIGAFKLLTPKQEIELSKAQLKGGKKAWQTMVEANLRLVVAIAKHFRGRGLSLDELISAGNVGLMLGVRKYDHRRGAKISTYISWWIKQRIVLAIRNQSKTVRVPSHLFEQWACIQNARALLAKEFGREPNPDDIAEFLDWPVAKINRLHEVFARTISFDELIDGRGEDGRKFIETVPDATAPDPYEETAEHADALMIREVLKTLPDRDREILDLRYGLTHGTTHTLEQVGAMYGVTRERIRQIEARVLRRLRFKLDHEKKMRNGEYGNPDADLAAA